MTPTKYSLAQRAIHWLTLLLMIGSFVSHEAMSAVWEVIEDGGTAVVTAGARSHQILGIAVFLLTLVRLGLRLRLGAPAPVAGQSAMVTLASALVHGLLYVLMLVIPLTGMMAFGGGIEAAAEVHEALFTLLLVLVAGHAGAALVHQFVLKDDLLSRMR